MRRSPHVKLAATLATLHAIPPTTFAMPLAMRRSPHVKLGETRVTQHGMRPTMFATQPGTRPAMLVTPLATRRGIAIPLTLVPAFVPKALRRSVDEETTEARIWESGSIDPVAIV
jgi:hypothetical protein